MTTLIEKSILNERLEKSRSGTYSDTSENRRKHRVGQKYGSEKKEEEKPEKTDPNKMSPEQQLEAINKVIAAVNEGKLKLPPEEINTLVAKKTMAEEAVKQAKGEKKPEEKEEPKKAVSSKEKIQEEEKKRGYRLDDNVIINDPNKTKEEKIAEIKDKYAKLAKEHAKELGDTPIGPDMVDLQKRKRIAIQKIEAQEEEHKQEASGKAPEGVTQASYDSITKNAKATQRGYTLNIDGKDVRVERTIDTSGGQRTPVYQIQGMDKKYWDLDKMIEAYRKDNKESVADKEDLRAAREKLGYLQDNEERLIKRDGKEKYEERLKQAKDEVAKLKGEKPKEEKKGEKKTDKASDPIYQVQQKKKEASKKYDSKREEARQKYDKEADEIRSEIDKLYESDHPDAAKKRKELWNTLKEKTNKYDAETSRLKDEYEAEYKKLDEAEDKLYDQRQKEETSEEVKESYTRVKFEDVPNSGKVNLKKYLSEKVRQGVDEKWSNIKNIPTDNLKKMEKGLVNDLNKNFEAIKKSQRAELLYSIMKVKGELEKRGKESQKKE